MSTEAIRKALLRILERKLIPLALREEPPVVVLMEPDYLCRSRLEVSMHPGEPLRKSKRLRSPMLLQHWPEQQIHTARFPCLQAVAEGEIDWRIGILEEQNTSPASERQQCDFLTVSIPEGVFFLTPSGVPYSDGQGLHWERSEPRDGRAIVFWLIVLPSGVMCHFCESSASQHHSHYNFFLACPVVFDLVKMLESELREKPPNPYVTRAHLQAILTYVQRELTKLVRTSPPESEAMQHLMPEVEPDLVQDTLQRARFYIEAHLRESLSPASVAAHSYLSISQVERYFERELGMSITKYITSRRVETAQVLLQNTNLLIRQVGEMVGYRNQSSFTQVFERYTGMSPSECRRKRT